MRARSGSAPIWRSPRSTRSARPSTRDETLAQYLTDGRGENLVVNGEQRHVVSYMKDFLFKPEQARTPVRELSGGERARLMLARVLARPANLLVLDEPTNDLDMETLDLLQELVAGFAGTVILVSHDRDFLDRTVTSVHRARTAAAAGSNMPAAIPTCWRSAAARARRARRKDQGRRPAERGERRLPCRAEGGARSKLSYKQKFALETLPGRSKRRSREIARLETKIADPASTAAIAGLC